MGDNISRLIYCVQEWYQNNQEEGCLQMDLDMIDRSHEYCEEENSCIEDYIECKNDYEEGTIIQTIEIQDVEQFQYVVNVDDLCETIIENECKDKQHDIDNSNEKRTRLKKVEKVKLREGISERVDPSYDIQMSKGTPKLNRVGCIRATGQSKENLEKRRKYRMMDRSTYELLNGNDTFEHPPAEGHDDSSDLYSHEITCAAEMINAKSDTEEGSKDSRHNEKEQETSYQSSLGQCNNSIIFAHITRKNDEVALLKDVKKSIFQVMGNDIIAITTKQTFQNRGSKDILISLIVDNLLRLNAKHKERTSFCRHVPSTETDCCAQSTLYMEVRNCIPSSTWKKSCRKIRNSSGKECAVIDKLKLYMTDNNTTYYTKASSNQGSLLDVLDNSWNGGMGKIPRGNFGIPIIISPCNMQCSSKVSTYISIDLKASFLPEKQLFLEHTLRCTFPPQVHAIYVYPVTIQQDGVQAPSPSPPVDWRWLLTCNQLDLRVDIDADTFYMHDFIDAYDDPRNSQSPVFPESRLTVDSDNIIANEFPRPLTLDHLVFHLWTELDGIRQATDMIVIHDRNSGSTFEFSNTMIEGHDYTITGQMYASFQQILYRCALLPADENRFAVVLEMPAQQFQISDVAVQTFLKHPNIIRMDTAVIQTGILKMFMEPFEVTLEEANRQRDIWRDQDILQMVFCLLDAVNTLHKNEVVHLNIHEKTVVLKHSIDPTSIAIWKFSSAQFDSNKLIPLEFSETRPRYCPPEWLNILQLQEYSSSMKKVDSWQIGCLMTKLLFREDPELLRLIPMRHEEQFDADHLVQENINESREIIRAEIRRYMGNRVIHPHLKKILFNFLEPCPDMRMSVECALALLRQKEDWHCWS